MVFGDADVQKVRACTTITHRNRWRFLVPADGSREFGKSIASSFTVKTAPGSAWAINCDGASPAARAARAFRAAVASAPREAFIV
jgi:hypothetical protein